MCCSTADSVEKLKIEILKLKEKSQLSDHYFKYACSSESKLLMGVEETPPKIAKFMVELTFKTWEKTNTNLADNLSNHHWFDPCSGAGVFPIEILKFYIEQKKVIDAEFLPKITIADISLIGIAITFIRIWNFLEENNISPEKYFLSEKVTLCIGDALENYEFRSNLFAVRQRYDMIIGNPPYVRANRLTKVYKDRLKSNFRELYCGTADLYTYFIGMGVQQLSDSGVLTYISPANFLRAKSCEALRNWLLTNASLKKFIDLDETKVFEDADLHAAIYTICKCLESNNSIKYSHVKNQVELNKLLDKSNFKLQDAVMDAQYSKGWSIHESKQSLEDFHKYFDGCISLKDSNINIYSGIRTGCINAYLVKKDELAKFSKEICDNWIKKILLPSNISKWVANDVDTHLIFIPHGSVEAPEELLASLQPYRLKLESRAEIKDTKRWYELRHCSYYEQMRKRKIAFPDISAQQRFSLVAEDVLISDGAYFIDSDDLILVGILNSSLAKSYFIKKCSSLGNLNAKGRFRFKKEFVKEFPIPKHTFESGEVQDSIRSLVSSLIKYGESEQLQTELDRQIYSLYQVLKC